MLTIPALRQLTDIVDIKPVGPDDFSDVRYVHATAFRMQARAHLREDDIQAFTDFVYSPKYADKMMGEDLYAAWLGREMLGTGGWCPGDDNSGTARIRSIFVRPLFTGEGLGRRLVTEAEGRARNAGFTSFSTRASINAVKFFQRLGYTVTSHGSRKVTGKRGLPVRFMRKSEPGAAIAAGADETAETPDAEAQADTVQNVKKAATVGSDI